ncbi:hypothetical protein [Legionella impletisoli]|uniref:Transmembrane protein n=1 Tax=Legionella impletisoli TaxID=343510 RepID=A0A917JS13_9GAMM|nr:hypothetical protein [Legionella impletisoli]GGI84006.1 hypothetical protein GCM10007966_10820 [Legionella impletisoli]
MAFTLPNFITNSYSKISSAASKVGSAVASVFKKSVEHNAVRMTAAGFYQLSMFYVMSDAISVFYEVDAETFENSASMTLMLLAELGFCIYGSVASYQTGKYLKQLEADENPTPNKVTRIAPNINGAQTGFVTGLQLYNFMLKPLINNLLANRIGMTVFGLFGSVIGAVSAGKEDKWAAFIVKKMRRHEILLVEENPSSKVSYLIQHAKLITPDLKAANMLYFTIKAVSSTPDQSKRAYEHGYYASIAGATLGLGNLGIFLSTDSYLGDCNKHLMGYLTDASYMTLGVAFFILMILGVSGDLKDAKKVDLGGFLYLAIPLALKLASSMTFEHYKFQQHARNKILKDTNSIEMEAMESGQVSEDMSGDLAPQIRKPSKISTYCCFTFWGKTGSANAKKDPANTLNIPLMESDTTEFNF